MQHLAIIMDGNGRWAQARGMPRIAGHRQGAQALRKLMPLCVEREIPFLTVYAFSSENWQRPQDEVSGLFDLLAENLEREAPTFHAEQIRLRVIGERGALRPALQQRVAEVEQHTAHYARLTLCVGLNYGGRQEILRAAEALRGTDAPLTEAQFRQALYAGDIPDPDLLIRTGGDQRISNFLLWQMAYTELVFSPILWPDFDASSLDDALAEYHRRERRFGAVTARKEGKK
jgi:undecaprenyl diphosphate synthase